MARQSQAPRSAVPHVLLTRPAEQSQRFARRLRTAWNGPLHIMIAPLMAPEFLAPTLPDTPPAGLIFSSETGVAAYSQLAKPPRAPAWCVGMRTAEMAQKAGLVTVLFAKDVATLTQQIVRAGPSGPLLHLRGRESTGNLAQTLTSADIPTGEAIVYDQRALPLAQRAIRLIQGQDPVIVPVFSARSMRLFTDAAPNATSLRLVALSDAVAAAAPQHLRAGMVICDQPDAGTMLKAVISLLKEPALP